MKLVAGVGIGKIAPDLAGQRARSHAHVAYVVGLLAVVNVFNYVDRMALAVLAPAIKADLDLSDAQLGLLIGFAFSLFYAVCAIPIAWHADRGSRRNIIAVSVGLWSLMTAACGAAQNVVQLFVARMGVGVGEAGCIPPAQSLIADIVPPARRPGAFAVHTLGLYVGMLLGMALAGWLGDQIGWRATFAVLGLPGIALALVVRLTVREPVRGGLDVGRSSDPVPLRKALDTLARNRTYRMLLLALIANGFMQFGLIYWWPSHFVRTSGAEMGTIGVYLGLAVGVGSGVGVLLGGAVANIVGRHSLRRPLVLSAGATLLALPGMLASLLLASFWQAIVCVFLAAVAWSICNAPIVAAVQSVTAPRMRAVASALGILLTSLLGAGLAPLLVGTLSDLLAPTFAADALRYALLLPALVAPALAVAIYLSSRTIEQDLARVRVEA